MQALVNWGAGTWVCGTTQVITLIYKPYPLYEAGVPGAIAEVHWIAERWSCNDTVGGPSVQLAGFVFILYCRTANSTLVLANLGEGPDVNEEWVDCEADCPDAPDAYGDSYVDFGTYAEIQFNPPDNDSIDINSCDPLDLVADGLGIVDSITITEE